MPRLPYPDLDGSDDRKRVEAKARDQRGGVLLNLYRMLLHSPVVADAWLGLGTAIRYRTGIGDLHRELSICLIALLTDCEYEWVQHAVLAEEAGATAEQLADLLAWETSPHFDEGDRVVLRYVERAALGRPMHDDEFERLAAIMSDETILELTALVGYYTGLSRFLVALGVDDEGEGG